LRNNSRGSIQFKSRNGASVFSLTDVIIGDIRPIILVLLGGADSAADRMCNVASLLFVRTQSRRREIAVRGALGAPAAAAPPIRTEGLVLAVTASLFGLAAAYGAMYLLTRLIPADILAGMPYLQGLGLSSHVLVSAKSCVRQSGALSLITSTCELNRVPADTAYRRGCRGNKSSKEIHRAVCSRQANRLAVTASTSLLLRIGGAAACGRTQRTPHRDLPSAL